MFNVADNVLADWICKRSADVILRVAFAVCTLIYFKQSG